MTVLPFTKATPVPASRCPHCGLLIDTHSWTHEGHMPAVGDLTICQGCAHVLRFGSRLTLNALTERDERALLAKDPEIRRQAQIVARRLPTSPTIGS